VCREHLTFFQHLNISSQMLKIHNIYRSNNLSVFLLAFFLSTLSHHVLNYFKTSKSCGTDYSFMNWHDIKIASLNDLFYDKEFSYIISQRKVHRSIILDWWISDILLFATPLVVILNISLGYICHPKIPKTSLSHKSKHLEFCFAAPIQKGSRRNLSFYDLYISLNKLFR